MARIARRGWTRRTHVLVAATIVGLVLAAGAAHVQAHKEKHSAADIKLFEDIFMEQVRLGDLLFHGDRRDREADGRDAVQDRHVVRDVPSVGVGHASPRVPQVLGAARPGRHAAGDDQLVHREAERRASASSPTRRRCGRSRRTTTGRARIEARPGPTLGAGPHDPGAAPVLAAGRRRLAAAAPLVRAGAVRVATVGPRSAATAGATPPVVTGNGNKVPLVVEMSHPMEPEHYMRSIEVANARDPVPSKGVFRSRPPTVRPTSPSRPGWTRARRGDVTASARPTGAPRVQLTSITIADGRAGVRARWPATRLARGRPAAAHPHPDAVEGRAPPGGRDV